MQKINQTKIETDRIYCGDCLKIIRKFPDKIIDCIVTSPPYWALRDYGKDAESIFDSKENCNHVFKVGVRKDPMDRGGYGDHDEKGISSSWKKRTNIKSGFCIKCGAWKGQLGLEPIFELYIKHLCDIFDEIKRTLKDEGTCWVNIGDTYYTKSGGSFLNDKLNSNKRVEKIGINRANAVRGKGLLEDKNLTLTPFRFAIEMQKRGWIVRNVIIWHKPNCMPTSVKDRFTVDFEYLFFFAKSKKYYFEQQREPHKLSSIERTRYNWNGHREPGSSYAGMNIKKMCHPDGRNKRCVWSILTRSFGVGHFAVYPPELIEIPIKAGCPEKGIVLDPFIGSGTTGLVAKKLGRKFLGIDINPNYCKIAIKRIRGGKNG